MEETLNDILRLASSLLSDAQLEVSRNERHFVFEGKSVTVLIFPTAKKYKIQCALEKQRRNNALVESTKKLSMTKTTIWTSQHVLAFGARDVEICST